MGRIFFNFFFFFFSLNEEEKLVVVSVQSLYSLYNKIEEHPLRILRNSNYEELFLYYCIIILGFPFVNCLKILQIKNEIWNQTLIDSYFHRSGLRLDILQIIFWFFLFVNICKNTKTINEKWNYTHIIMCMESFTLD